MSTKHVVEDWDLHVQSSCFLEVYNSTTITSDPPWKSSRWIFHIAHFSFFSFYFFSFRDCSKRVEFVALRIGEGHRSFGDLSGTLHHTRSHLLKTGFFRQVKELKIQRKNLAVLYYVRFEFRRKEPDKFWRIIRTRNLVLWWADGKIKEVQDEAVTTRWRWVRARGRSRAFSSNGK